MPTSMPAAAGRTAVTRPMPEPAPVTTAVLRPRPESDFDAAEVFAACAETGTALEINSRPKRLDPPRRLLRRAGVLFSLDTDAHAPGRLDRGILGCARAQERGVPPERVVTTWSLDGLPAWARERKVP